jgi:hypothetical protein
MKARLKRLVISVSVLALIFHVGLGLNWTDTAWAIGIVGFLLFILQAVFDFGHDVARAVSREQTNFNLTQNVVEEHKHNGPIAAAGSLHPDFTWPDSAREAYPAVITMRRERKAK